MNDTDLRHKAIEMSYAYRELYGSFPNKIGIHYKRLSTFWSRSLFFPVPPPREALSSFVKECTPFTSSVTYTRHEATFEPVLGAFISEDEVYFPDPADETRVLPASRIAQMAKEFV